MKNINWKKVFGLNLIIVIIACISIILTGIPVPASAYTVSDYSRNTLSNETASNKTIDWGVNLCTENYWWHFQYGTHPILITLFTRDLAYFKSRGMT